MSHDADGAGTAPEQAWLGTLFTAHAEHLYRLARRLTPSADEALDLVQETFLRAGRNDLGSVNHEGRLSPNRGHSLLQF